MLWYLSAVLLGLSVLGLGLVLGCARAEVPARWVAASPASSGRAAPAPSAAASAASAAPLGGLSLSLSVSPEPQVLDLPVLEIQAPFAGQRVPLRARESFEVRFTVNGETGSKAGEVVDAVLDSSRPRRFGPGESIRLGQLVPEDAELAPGQHRLFMVVTRDGVALRPGTGAPRAPYAVVDFSVAEPSTAPFRSPVDAPRLVMLRPEGTYNGRAADEVPVDIYVVGSAVGAAGARIRLSVSGAGGAFTATLADAAPRRLSGLPSGDFEVAVELVGANGQPLAGARAARTITVNREISAGAGRP